MARRSIIVRIARTRGLWIAIAMLPLVLGGCALFVATPAVTYASLAANGASLSFTGKTVAGHALSAAAEKDCSIWRLFKGERICREPPPDTRGTAIGAAKAAVVTRVATNGTNGTNGVERAPRAADGRMLLVSAPGNTRFNVRVKSLAELRFTKVVRQRYDVSCGAAALATLFTYYYGMPMTEKQIMDDIFKYSTDKTEAKIRRYGFSMLEMKRAGERLGFKGGGFRIADVEKLVKLKIPAIALVNIRGYNHFVVIKGVTGGQVFIADPAFGNRTRPLEGFAGEWNNVVLVFLSPTRKGNEKFKRDGTLKARADGLINIFDRGVRSRIAPVSGEF